MGGIDKARRMHYLSLLLLTLLSTTATATGGSSSAAPDPFQSLPPEAQFRGTALDHSISHNSNPPWATILWALAAAIFLILIAIKVFFWLSSSPAPAANTVVLRVPDISGQQLGAEPPPGDRGHSSGLNQYFLYICPNPIAN